MVQSTKIFLLAKLSSTSTIAQTTVPDSAKGLYKYLIRQCNRLPKEEITSYYKHYIRQGFNQHADESDPQRVTQIINQAVKDFDWILKKWWTMEMENDINHKKIRDPVTIKNKIYSINKFFNAFSTFTSRPELITPHARSTDIEWESFDPDLRIRCNEHNSNTLFDYLYSSIYHNGKSMSTSHVSELTGSLYEDTINAWLLPSNKFKSIELIRLIHNKPTKTSKLGSTYKVKEVWDFENLSIEWTPILSDKLKSVPYLPRVYLVATYSIEDYTASITVNYAESFEPGPNESSEFYCSTVVPKIFEWMSDDYTVKPSRLTRLRPRPHVYVNNSRYWLFHDLIKAGPAEYVKQIWKESTDPVKFIHEDIGISAYIASFIFGEKSKYRPVNNTDIIDILDLGCGNGLLCFFLSQVLSVCSKSANIIGFDIRRRRIWEDLILQDEVNLEMKNIIQSSEFTSDLPFYSSESVKPNLNLTERAFVPHLMDDLINRYGATNDDRKHRSLWIIGNHSDELTPWIPVVARRLNASGFFIIPCCPYDFFSKYQRHPGASGSSVYHNYIEYICSIGDRFGYQPTLEKLRIPSTKNVCLLGLDCSRKFDNCTLERQVDDIINKLKTGDSNCSLYKFVPRNKDSAHENPKLDATTSRSIVNKIFQLLIKNTNNFPVDKWNTGREDVTFSVITDALSEKEREMLKGKGRGLKTVVKSHRNLFYVKENFVRLKMPNVNDIQNVRDSSRNRIKTRDCYFKVNHPQGCPLPNELCPYKH